MALSQKIINEQGATITYHRISSVFYNCEEGMILANVKSYVSEKLRKQEKDFLDIEQKLSEYQEELDELVENPTEDNKARRVELANEINQISESTEPQPPKHLISMSYELPCEKLGNFSLESVYLWLKENIYKEAEDC